MSSGAATILLGGASPMAISSQALGLAVDLIFSSADPLGRLESEYQARS